MPEVAPRAHVSDDMPDKHPNRPDPDNRVGRLSKNAAFLMMMALMLLLAIQIVRGQDELAANFTYTEFREYVSEGRVFKVTFKDRVVEGELNSPITRDGQEVVRFETRLPGDLTDGLLVEDIVDSGTTLEEVVPRLLERGARTVEICTLLHKRLGGCRHEPRFVGFDAPNAFLVGYGLDHAEDFRQLPYIASL